jgi:tetratricopeptide (TPR) repeat protein
MAAVWLATDERLGRQVAIKVLSDTVADDGEFLDRFRREARVAAGLHHPNLVQVFDFDAGDRPYLVMEFIEGGSLAGRIAEGEAPEPEALARELLSALRHIHSNGVLHRDVKPENVLIDADGHARLTDFGIAQPTGATSLTQTGQVIGTERYMAPEVRAGEPASERSDLYATGVVLAEASRDGASAALWSLIERLRDPGPERRPLSATAALAILERAATITSGPEPTKPFDARPAETARSHRRSAVAAALAVLAALAAVVLVVALSRGGDDGGQPAKATADQPKPTTTTESQTTTTADQTSTTTAQVANDGTALNDGAALNDQGFALIGSGDYEAAIPILQRAVDQLEGSSDRLTYGYALYNLGHALRLAGRPEEAIPILEQRLQIPDQQATVEAELAAARADAAATGGAKPEKKPKPEKPPKEGKPGHGPPPSANGDGAVEPVE